MIDNYLYLTKTLEEIKELRVFNYEMMDSLRNQISWLLRYCKANNIPLPDFNTLVMLLDRANITLEASSDESLQPSESDADLTEPRQWFC